MSFGTFVSSRFDKLTFSLLIKSKELCFRIFSDAAEILRGFVKSLSEKILETVRQHVPAADSVQKRDTTALDNKEESVRSKSLAIMQDFEA
eukprot:IDg15302t1